MIRGLLGLFRVAAASLHGKHQKTTGRQGRHRDTSPERVVAHGSPVEAYAITHKQTARQASGLAPGACPVEQLTRRPVNLRVG
jgi:hypothetical protein